MRKIRQEYFDSIHSLRSPLGTASRRLRLCGPFFRCFKYNSSLTLATGLLLCLAAAFGGCVLPGSRSGEIKFSPDSSKVAYIWLDEWTQFSFEPNILSRTISIKWCGVESPDVLKSVRIGSFGRKWSGYINVPTSFEFSPDSKHIAILIPWRLSVIDLDSGKRRYISKPDEIVSSFAWIDNDEVGYVAHTKLHRENTMIADRTFWRQKINASADVRVVIHLERGVKAGVDFLSTNWPLEHWSPNGRHVVFMSQFHGGPFKLLDVAGGTVRAFGQSDSHSEGVAWKPDGSAAVCISRKLGQYPPEFEFLLVDSTTGRSEDFTKPFATLFVRHVGIFGISWAYEGNYLFGGYTIQTTPEPIDPALPTSRIYSCRFLLIRLHPWHVLDVGEKIGQRFSQIGHVCVSPGFLDGCVYARGEDKKGIWKRYAVDCTGSHFWQISGIPSPNGLLTATIGKDKKLQISKATPPEVFFTKHWAAETQERGGSGK